MSAKRKHGRENLAGWLMSLPALLMLTVFVLIPFISAFIFSFYNIKMNTERPPTWMGLEQYRRILFDPDLSPIFYKSLRNNFQFAIMVVPIQTGLALLLAVMLNVKLKGIAFFRIFYFMPVVFPMSLVAVIWKLIYSRDELGIANSVLKIISFGAIEPIDWLGDARIALISIAILSVWAGVGFQMVIILAGLQEIPSELYEAASLDKAGKFKQFLHITIPGLRNTLIFVVIITTIFSLRLFDQVYILTPDGGQNDSTSTVMFRAVNAAFTEGSVGTGSAYTVVFVTIIIAITLLQRFFLRENREVK